MNASQTPISIPLDYMTGPTRVIKPVRPYRRRDGRRTYLYQFEYGVQGVFTELPTWITVRSVNMKSAIKVARYHVAHLVRQEYGPELADKWRIYPGHRIKIRRPKPRPLTPEQRETIDRLFRDVISRPILEIIEKAPVMSELFGSPTFPIPS